MNTLYENFARSFTEFASRVAAVNGTARLTYAELEDHVDRFADALRRRGVTAGSKVRSSSKVSWTLSLHFSA